MARYTFAGIPVKSFHCSRGRGVRSGKYVMHVVTDEFPGDELFVPPSPPPRGVAKLDAPAFPLDGRKQEYEAPRRIPYSGFLEAHEPHGREFKLGPLYVVRAERVKTSDVDDWKGPSGDTPGASGSPSIVRITCVDSRGFWGSRGFLRRWSYNRVEDDGEWGKDSQGGAEGSEKPISLLEIAQDVAAQLPFGHRITDAPDRWREDFGQQDFIPYGLSAAALASIADYGKTLPACLRLDDTIAMHKAGDGSLGYASSGAGANDGQLDKKKVLFRGGTGWGYASELTHPSDYAVIRFGPTVETVQIEECQPVLMLNQFVIFLTDDNVKRLTDGQWGIEALKRFITKSDAIQSAAGINPSVLKLFKDQAWRMFMVADAFIEKTDEDESKEEQKRLTEARDRADELFRRKRDEIPGFAEFLAEREQGRLDITREGASEFLEAVGRARQEANDESGLSELLQRIADEGRNAPRFSGKTGVAEIDRSGFPRLVPGKNAHLLPILKRAETEGGKRLPPRFESSWYEVMKEARRKPFTAQKKLERALAKLYGAVGPDGKAQPGLQDQLVVLANRANVTFAGPKGVPDQTPGQNSTLRSLKNIARQAKHLREAGVDGAKVSEWESAQKELLKARDELNGTNSAEIYELAKEVVDLEEELVDEKLFPGQDIFDDPTAENLGGAPTGPGDEFRETPISFLEEAIFGSKGASRKRIERLLRQIREINERADKVEREGVETQERKKEEGKDAEIVTQQWVENRGPDMDVAGRIMNAEMGVFKLSRRAGHIKTDTPNIKPASPAQGAFDPKPVMIQFGSVKRGRLDRPPEQIPTGEKGRIKAPPLVEPDAYFVKAFRRKSSDYVDDGDRKIPDEIDIKDVPSGDGTPVLRDDLSLLIPLEGSGNRQQLEDIAEQEAANLFSKPPAIESETVVMAGWWPVQCDGRVSLVEWRTIGSDGTGVQTVIHVGDIAGQAEAGGTRTRDPQSRRTPGPDRITRRRGEA